MNPKAISNEVVIVAKPGATGITRIINATGYSMKGLKSAWVNEAAFRQELLLILLLMPLAFWIGDSLNGSCCSSASAGWW